jgi:hypothetical protein
VLEHRVLVRHRDNARKVIRCSGAPIDVANLDHGEGRVRRFTEDRRCVKAVWPDCVLDGIYEP